MIRRKGYVLLILLSFVLTIFLAGCGSGTEEPPQIPGDKSQGVNKEPLPEPGDTPEEITYKIYFGDENAEKLKSESMNFPKGEAAQEIGTKMVQALINGPSDSKLNKTIPDGTKLLSLTIKDKVATLDFNPEIQTNHSGGSAGEIMTVYSIVNTLTQLPEIEAIQFLIEGQMDEAIWGHLDTSSPLNADSSLNAN